MKYSNVTDPSRTRDLVSGASILPSLSGRIQSNSTFNFNSRVIQSLYESDLILVGHNVDEKSALNPEKAEDRGNFDRRLITVPAAKLPKWKNWRLVVPVAALAVILLLIVTPVIAKRRANDNNSLLIIQNGSSIATPSSSYTTSTISLLESQSSLVVLFPLPTAIPAPNSNPGISNPPNSTILSPNTQSVQSTPIFNPLNIPTPTLPQSNPPLALQTLSMLRITTTASSSSIESIIPMATNLSNLLPPTLSPTPTPTPAPNSPIPDDDEDDCEP